MARRREKRSSATESSERRHNRDESKPRDGEPDSDRRLITIFVVFFIVIPAVSMAVYKVKFADRVIEAEPSIRQKGIIKTDIHFQEILTVSVALLFFVSMFENPLKKKAERFRGFEFWFRNIQRRQRIHQLGIMIIQCWLTLRRGWFLIVSWKQFHMRIGLIIFDANDV